VTRTDSFFGADVAKTAFGSKGIILTDASLVLACFGALCSYLVVIADMLVPLLAHWTHQEQEMIDRTIILSLATVLLMPLAAMRYINMYRYTSLLALIAILYLVVVVVVRSGESIGDMDLGCNDNGCLTIANFTVEFFYTIRECFPPTSLSL